MTVHELITKLLREDMGSEIMVLDGYNGGGSPRTINLGPHKYAIDKDDADGVADCEGRDGEQVIVIGYGCY
jgi:hypothetical protein